MKNLSIFISKIEPVTKLHTKTKCRSCAYHRPSTPEEDEMTIAYWHELPLPHQCHERQKGWACKGAVDACKRLGLMK